MKRDDNAVPSKKLTGAKLKELIQAVIKDSYSDAMSDEQLLADEIQRKGRTKTEI